MRLGISTACLYPLYTELSLCDLAARGFRVFEIFFNSESECQQPMLRQMLSTLQESNCRLRAVHPYTSAFESFLLFSEYRRRFEDGVSFYQRYFEAAAYLGAKIVVIHGDRYPFNSQVSDNEYFERFAVLAEVGASEGVVVAQENVNGYRSQDPDFIRRMTKYLYGEVNYVFDIKQAVRAGVDPYTMCETMGKQLAHVHLNDHSPGVDCLLPGQGIMDYNRMLDILRKNKYSGDFIIEVYRDSFEEMFQLMDAYEDYRDLFDRF